MAEKMGTAAILAGGNNKRIGYAKAWLDIAGIPLIQVIVDRLKGIFCELVIVADDPDEFSSLPARTVTDIITDVEKSSLRGIHAALHAASTPDCFVIACDMPFADISFIRHMHLYINEYDAVVPALGQHFQPLYAFYRKECLPLLEYHLRSGQLKIFDLYAHLKVKYVGEAEIRIFGSPEHIFFNINTHADYEEARRIIAGLNEQVIKPEKARLMPNTKDKTVAP